MRPEDREVCRGFRCGEEAYERQVELFITRDLWEGGYPGVETLIAVPRGSAGPVLGFGTWRFTDVVLLTDTNGAPPSARWMFIPFFGLATEIQGRRDSDGIRWSDRLYRAVERRAIDVAPEPMFFEVVCHASNTHGDAFWRRQGFRDVGESPHDPAYRRYLLWPHDAPPPDWLLRAVEGG